MKTFFLVSSAFFSIQVLALDSEMIFTGPELKENTLVQKVKGPNDENLSVGAARILQLQVNASGCDRAIVTPHTLQTAIQYKYTISADNCLVKLKNQDCDDGFGPKDLLGNPNTPEYAIIGAEKYKVCIKGAPGASRNNGNSNGPAPAGPAPTKKPHSGPKDLLELFSR